jgi:isopenicillin-N N-acyltransferase-like protein
LLKKYEFSGTPREIGYEHGKALKTEIHELYQQFMGRFLELENPPKERSMLGVTNAYLDATEQFCPELIEEMEAIAEGAEIDFEKIFFLNLFDELGVYPKLREESSHCTTFLATDVATQDGKTYLGQGWDMKPIFEPIIFQINPSHGPSMLMLSHPGIIGGAGINQNGVSLVWNTVKATDERIGIPVVLLIRKVLEAKNLNDGLMPLLNCNRASGFNFIIGNEFGGFNIEATATKEYITYITNTFGHANHYEADSLREYESEHYARRTPDTYIRTGRMKQLLERNYGEISLETCKVILSDHANYPASICKHKTPNFYNVSETKSSIIFIPEERIMLASDGQPCEAGFDTFKLE